MFYPIKNGTKYIVREPSGDEFYECWIPPVPDPSEIINYGLPIEEQYWKREPIPKWFFDKSQEEERNNKIDPMCERYRRKEWKRRKWGVFFMNGGELTYLTGHHYFYLQYGKSDHKENNGYPYFYNFSKESFYFRQWCEENPKSMGYLIIASRGTGKCLGRGTKVMMYRGGVKNVEDVVVGDLVMGPDSKPRRVLELSSGIDDLYEVVQNRGMNYVVNSKHILSLKRNSGISFTKKKSKGRYYNRFPNYGNIVNIPVLDFVKSNVSFKNNFSGYKVGVEYSQKKVDIDPYFLGLWLGDGWRSYPIIVTMDKEVVNWLDQYSKSLGQILSKHESKSSGKASAYCISKEGARSNPNPLLNTMRKMGLINNKHIPDKYLYNSRKIRLALLAGLIDTDGSFNKGRYELTQVRKHLAEQILVLVNGLGFKASLKEKIVNGTTYYRVGFSGKIDIPVLLDRKINRGNPNKDNLITRIDDVKPLGRGEFFGFELDGDHLFCLEDGTVTHNTQEELSCIINRATMNHNHRAALQSNDFEVGAKGVLIQAKTVPMFNALPKFFKPNYAHGTNTQSELVFRRSSVRGEKSLEVEFGEEHELLSAIFAVGPGEKVLDKETLGDVLEDEVGKCDPKKVADVYVRHETNIKTVFRNHRKVGLLRKTTTVEEMNEGGDECFKLWKDSDPKQLDGNGFTTSKIHRHLISALDTDTSLEPYIDGKKKNWGAPCDKYGRVNREISNIKIQHDFDALKHDLKKLSSRMRKSPRNVSEAFIKDQSKSIFNVMLLTNRLEQIRNMTKPPYVRGNLYWAKDKFGPVWWQRDDHAGRFKWAWFPDEFSKIKDPNQTKILNNIGEEWGYDKKGFSRKLLFPKNDHLFRIGSDPIKYSKTKDPRASKAAIHGFRLFDGNEDYGKLEKDWNSHNFIFEYVNRPDDPEMTFEDTAMACIFLGCKLFPERNVPSLNDYFETNGLERFLYYPSESNLNTDIQTNSDDAGWASTSEVIDYYTRRIIAFINRHIHRMPFDDTIEDWLGFDSSNPTKSDATVSSGFTLVHAERVVEADKPPEHTLEEWFESYDNTGSTGKFNYNDN